MSDDAFDEGMRIRREVLGAEHVDRAIEQTTEQTRDFQDFITRYAWGEIWARPGLDRRTRSCITLTALVALGRFDELALHIRGARRNGLSDDEISEVLLHSAVYCGARRNGVTDDEISEVLLHSAVYCGVPAANSAFAVFRRVVDEG